MESKDEIREAMRRNIRLAIKNTRITQTDIAVDRRATHGGCRGPRRYDRLAPGPELVVATDEPLERRDASPVSELISED